MASLFLTTRAERGRMSTENKDQNPQSGTFSPAMAALDALSKHPLYGVTCLALSIVSLFNEELPLWIRISIVIAATCILSWAILPATSRQHLTGVSLALVVSMLFLAFFFLLVSIPMVMFIYLLQILDWLFGRVTDGWRILLFFAAVFGSLGFAIEVLTRLTKEAKSENKDA
jgi:hypothetical protein